VDEKNRKSSFGSVWTVPVSESFRQRAMGSEKSKGAHGEDCGGSKERIPIEVEGVVAHVARRYRVDDEHTQ